MSISKSVSAVFIAAAAACAAPETSSDTQQSQIKDVEPGASVSFAHILRSPVAPGGNGVLELTVNENYAAGTMEIVAVSDGLDLAAASRSMTVSMAGADEHRWDVYFDAPNGGVHYIDFSVTATDENDVTASRAHSAAVNIGDGAVLAKPDAPIVIDADGEAVILMNAEETIEE